jgi:hypothetical protein
MEAFYPLHQCNDLYLQHVTHEDLDFMGGFVSSVRSILVVVHNFTLLGSAVSMCNSDVFNPPFFTYIREDDDYDSVISRVSKIMGEYVGKLRLGNISIYLDL